MLGPRATHGRRVSVPWLAVLCVKLRRFLGFLLSQERLKGTIVIAEAESANKYEVRSPKSCS